MLRYGTTARPFRFLRQPSRPIACAIAQYSRQNSQGAVLLGAKPLWVPRK